MKKSILSFVCLALWLVNSSCDTNDVDPQVEYDLAPASSVAESENALQDALLTADDAFDGSEDGLSGARVSACAVITHNVDAKTVVIDFQNGCTSYGGRTRSGKITILYEGTRSVSTKRTLTFENYSFQSSNGSYSLSGTLVTSYTYNSTGYAYSIVASNLSLNLSDGETFNVDAISRSFVYINNSTPRDISDDKFTITGTSANTDSDGKTTTVTINSSDPVIIKGMCLTEGNYYPSSGSYEVVQNALKYLVSWGSGTCDKEVQITIGGKTSTKVLP